MRRFLPFRTSRHASPDGDLIARLEAAVGRRHVLRDAAGIRPYARGIRFGGGPCVAVVRPGSLVEQWQVVQACVDHDAIVIMQAANTGLTGGSTPFGEDYDRSVVIVNALRLNGNHVIRQGRQVICLPGSTLYDLERLLAPFGREPHSVIGSSCIGASVIGGLCNNSGGSLIRRGPAFTELAIFARIGADGRLALVNHLGVRLGDDPETILRRLEQGDFTDADVDDAAERRASDGAYEAHVRQIDEATPARFNADPSRLFEASGSAGRVVVFAVRLDTFAREADTRVFYVGTNDPADLTRLRRRILADGATLPISGEYMHREAFDITAAYGRDTYVAIGRLGTDRLPALFRWKARVDHLASLVSLLPDHPTDRAMQWLSRFAGQHLPARMIEYRDRFEHHLMLKTAGDGIAEMRDLLASECPPATADFFECDAAEGEAAFRHRFVAAGAANRYRAIHADAVEDIVALDLALPRNERNWREELPADLDARIVHKLHYGHFLCHVFHADYIVRRGEDAGAIKAELCALLDARGAEYPAEHNVGHLYKAKPVLVDFYRSLDPVNAFNPGIGGTSKRKWWAAANPGWTDPASAPAP